MTLIYYDVNMPKQNLHELSKKLRETIGDEVLFLPKGFDVYLNASRAQLISAKNAIESALALIEK